MAGEALGLAAALHSAQHAPARNIYAGWGPLLFVWQRGLLAWLECWQPDVLIADSNPRNVSTSAAIRWMHTRQRPVIGWGLGAPRARYPLAGLFNRSRDRYLRQFDALISYSSTGREQFAAAGFPPERIFLAPNAVTARPTQPPPARPPTYPNGQPRVLFVGRLQERKRIDSLLRACAGLPLALRPRLVIVGDGPARANFEALARTLYPDAAFTGDLRGAALAAEFAAADLFVLPGTGGLAVQQAMSYGLPVIVAEADGTQANLVRPANGWLLPANDLPALQACLAAALADPARLRQMGQESYRIVDQEVNLEKMVEVFTSVIAGLLVKACSAGFHQQSHRN
jgi:glycosyltransferase involved in cell wall biosynthesis